MKYLNDVRYRDCIGKICKSNLSGDFKIVKYNDSYNVEIQFLKTGYETVALLNNIRNGRVKDLYSPSVYSIGIVVLNIHLRLMVSLQKSITYGTIC